MLISHKYKFVFIHISKNAGSSIFDVLSPYSQIKAKNRNNKQSPLFHQHDGAFQLISLFTKQGWDWNKYFSFAFVRNPWARIVSKYEYWKKIANSNKKSDWKNFCTKVIAECRSFSEFIESKYPYEQRNQSDFLYESGKLLVSFVGRQEKLQEDFDKICYRIGIPTKQLPVLNKTKHKPYQEYYNEKTKSIVAEKFADDINNFNYTFM